MAEFEQIYEEALFVRDVVSIQETDPSYHSDRLKQLMLKKSLSDGLETVYSGMENIMSRIASDIDGGKPGGEAWHQRLLNQMALDIPHVRPKMLSEKTAIEVKKILKFWHRSRHMYSASIDLRRLLDLAHMLPETLYHFFDDARRLSLQMGLAEEGEFLAPVLTGYVFRDTRP
ncbi:MAG: ribonuclease toxin HepT-like protein [Acidiferrobacter sp.]